MLVDVIKVAFTLTHSRSQAVQLFNNIGSKDPDGLIQWEVDFPAEEGDWTPFLGTEVRVMNNVIESRFYRKPTRKRITLHYNSHHPLQMKVQTAKNFYHTAVQSSSPSTVDYSLAIVDDLLTANGYQNPRAFAKTHVSQHQHIRDSYSDPVLLKLPYISENFSNQICRYIKSNSLPIKVVFTPGKKLREIFCSSRPLDRPPPCLLKGCRVCPLLEEKDCQVIAPVYRITCNLCSEIYIGETGRTAKERLSEHLRCATSPTAKSYRDKALALHYSQFHPSTTPDLSFTIITTEKSLLHRKILEAVFINKLKPSINLKEEMSDLSRFLVT